MAENQPPDEQKKTPKLELSPSTLELSKALIGCGGGILTALITGVFLLLTNSGVFQGLFSPPTAVPTVTASQAVVAVSTTIAIAATPAGTDTPIPTASITGKVSPITFAAGVYGVEPIEAGTRFPAGITKVYAIFAYEDIVLGTPWRTELYFNGKLFDQASGLWRGTVTGSTYFWKLIPDGFPAGEWEFRTYLTDVLARSGTFVIYARPAEAPYFGTIQFAENMRDGQPVNPYMAGQFLFPAGITQLTAYFRAGNIHDGVSWEARWYRNDDLIDEASQQHEWRGASATDSYVSAQLANPQGLTEGTYALKLSIAGETVQLATFIVSPANVPATVTPAATAGDSEPTQPTLDATPTLKPGDTVYGPFTFAAGSIDTIEPVAPGTRFPQSITQIVAIYPYRLPTNSPWRDEWYLDGELFAKHSGVWTAKTEGVSNSWLWDKNGLPPGKWELRSLVDGVEIQRGSFTIVAREEGAPGFGAITFAEGIKDGAPVNAHEPRELFSSETNELVAFFTGNNIEDDMQWTAEWYYNNNLLTSIDNRGGSSSDLSFTARLNSLQRLPGGTYMLRLILNGEIVQMATCIIDD